MEENVIIAMDAEKSKKIKGIPSSWNWEDIHFYLITELGFSFDVVFNYSKDIEEVPYEGLMQELSSTILSHHTQRNMG